MTISGTTPLPADPERQADAMLRACEYQILQTVSAWLDLRGDEVLYVEGAEDFDKTSPTTSEAVQVKTSPKPISLGQKEIQETLNHYWKLRLATTGRDVRMRFLTCARFTVERGNPFGANVPGLELWQRRPLGDLEAQQLAGFLVKQQHIEPTFQNWLKRATPSQFRTEVVERVTWQVQAEDAHFVERGIYNKLASFAEKRGTVLASVTKQVARRLIVEVWKILREPPPRCLDFIRLEELWEEATCISVPRSALDARLNEHNLRSINNLVAPIEQLLKGIPPLPGVVTQRLKLVSDWRSSLAVKGVLNLHGSTRTGKTTLAKLIALPDAEQWKWWSAARTKQDETQRNLQLLVNEVVRFAGNIQVVLDDLDFSPVSARHIEEPLGELIALVNGRRGRVVITSQKPLPTRLQHAFGLEAAQVIAVPRLDDEEVDELAAELGCKDETHRSAWARLVRASTSGHPLLAAMRLIALRQQGWPAISAATLASSANAIDAERADARQLLDGLPATQRDLLQRLSVFPIAFRRDHAVAIGANPPPLFSPGTAFDSCVGPWVEPLHAGYFALSPLLAENARAALAPNDFKILQNETALVLLETEPYATMDVAHAFLLFWQTRNENMLLALVQDWMEMEEPVFGSLSKSLLWFTLIALGPGQFLLPNNSILSFLLRWLQIKVAVNVAPEHAIAIIDGWRWELDNGTYAEPKLQRMFFAGFVLMHEGIPLDAVIVVKSLGEVAEAEVAYPEMPLTKNIPREKISELAYLPEWNDAVSTLSFLSSSRCKSFMFLDNFLTALEETNSKLRERILRGFISEGRHGELVLDRVWLAESEREVPDWTSCLRVYERAIDLGRTWKNSTLASASLRGICVIIDEYFNDHQRALETLNQISTATGFIAHIVHDRRANILLSLKNYSLAEEEWRLALASWPRPLEPFDNGAAFAARGAGVSAARQEHWDAAAIWFKEIIEQHPTKEEVALIAGAYADAGYCLWKAGKKKEAVASLIEAWRLTDTLPSGRENLRAFITRKTVGHVIAWLHGKATQLGAADLNEPIAGVCSSAEMPEKMKELPETDSANVWLFLMRLERELEAGSCAVELGREVLAKAVNPTTRAIASMEAIAQQLAHGQVEALPTQVIAMARAVQSAAEDQGQTVMRSAPEDFEKDEHLRGASLFLSGLVVSQAKGSSWPEMLKNWRTSLPADAGDGWSDWFNTIENKLAAKTTVAAEFLYTSGNDWAGMMLAAWCLMISEDSMPDELFYAHARWLSELKRSNWLLQTSDAFCQQVQVAWNRVIQTPALLLLPRVTIPAIKEAYSHGKPGVGRAARILLAASNAVKLRMSPEMIGAFKKMAEEDKI